MHHVNLSVKWTSELTSLVDTNILSQTEHKVIPWFVRMNHRYRWICFAILFAIIGLHMSGGNYEAMAWLALGLQFLVYPHLLCWRARSAPDPKRAEMENLFLDSFFVSIWAAALGFPLWITFVLFVGATYNPAMFLGLKGLGLSLTIIPCGVLIGIVLTSMRWLPQTSWPVTLMCMMGLLLYLYMVAYGAYTRAQMLRDARERLKGGEQALHTANDALQHQLDEIGFLQTRLKEQANRDPLTGLYNRRYLDSTIARELARCKREGHPLTLMLIDIDHFKKVNDTYGHQAGDQVLCQLASMLQTRAGDIACRYGGEEFLLLLPNIPQAIALERAEMHRRAFEEMRIRFGNASIRSTLSTGIATYPEHGVSPEELIRCADEALYLAKQGGRNRVVVYSAKTSTSDSPNSVIDDAAQRNQ